MFALRRLPAVVIRCRLLRWSALVVYVCVSCGFSAPIPSGKDLSRAFPCMYSRCGCQNADQCWRSCCCHTVSERLAWARAHGVAPPEYVHSLSEKAVPPVKKSCCTAHQPAAKTTHSCCSSHAERATCVHHRDTKPERGVSFLQALRCRGLSANWIGMAPSVVSDQFECSISFQVIEWLTPSPVVLPSQDLAPPIPPPRLATA